METSFTPSPDVVVILSALLDRLESRAKHNLVLREAERMYNAPPNISSRSKAEWTNHETRSTQHAIRSIKVSLTDISLPTYFSQTDPQPRIVANEQLQTLEHIGVIKLAWHPGETGYLIQSVMLQTEHAPLSTQHAPRPTQHESLYKLLQRTPTSNHRNNLESLILAEKFRFDDWRARALDYILNQLHAGKSPSPFSLTDSNLNLDLLAGLQALSTLQAETPYRVFSVRVFNDTKRFEIIKSQLVTLARIGNPEWKRIPAEEALRELNLVANPTYIHFSGNWQFTTDNGEILNLIGFTPSIGFPAAQIATLQSVRAESVLCIENLTTFHQYIRQTEHAIRNTQHVDKNTGTHVNNGTRNTQHAVICAYGNPSPAVRCILRLLLETTPMYLWSDLDYGGFNILSQLRRTVGEQIQPYLMDINTLEANIPRARPLTASDRTHLKRLLLRAELRDVYPIIEYLLKRGLKLEQEGVENF